MGSLSLPPPSSTSTSSLLQQLPSLQINTCWGSSDELSTLISSWKPYIDKQGDCEVHGGGNSVLFWCRDCVRGICGGCVKDHTTPSLQQHTLIPLTEANDSLIQLIEQESQTVGNLLSEIYQFERKQQDLTLKLIDALQIVKTELEGCLVMGGSLITSSELSEIHSLLTSPRGTATPPPAVTTTAAAAAGQPSPPATTTGAVPSPHLSTLYKSLSTRRSELTQLLTSAHPLLSISKSFPSTLDSSIKLIHSFTTMKLQSLPNPVTTSKLFGKLVLGPRFYFDMEIIGIGGMGRIIIETRPDVAPRMCENFHSLVRGDRGFGFEGCVVFQCWRGESVITGDFEHQNGRGGHSIFSTGLFMPEDTRLPATRGALGMRRTQKRHDSKGLVGSQFRIILQDMPGFTGIFGHVLDGIEVVERISECGDASGNPMKRCVVRRCGEV